MFKNLKTVLRALAAKQARTQHLPRSGNGVGSVLERLAQDRQAHEASTSVEDTVAPWSVLGPVDGLPTPKD
jgi:hypothetical protein